MASIKQDYDVEFSIFFNAEECIRQQLSRKMIRYNILVRVVECLINLAEYKQGIVHRDIKLGDVLLDNNYNAKVVLPRDRSHLKTNTAGTKEIEDGRVMPVKKCSYKTTEWDKWFFNEINLISSIEHKNFVKLLGCCITISRSLLVYEYMPNGSLKQCIPRFTFVYYIARFFSKQFYGDKFSV